jgi:hypothetical protein
MQVTRGKEYDYVRPFTLYVCLSVMLHIPLVVLSVPFVQER